ncbi:SepM family pheromone-processing serine protease [Salibacterium halotolerans]|uniref:endopeptidase La n=1 Tax=Salibacterium halotolerans TaxID=1884432 RepID=A0A1I5M384_9BACI|nr:SepM family pheromone-processing serine protease [Salibacterium halotolerans]SFP04064.1 PDZ domain-containing protein [Salibacterium halotolerans]
MMKQLRSRRIWIIIIVLLAVLALNQISLPYYYSQPGEASSLQDMVTVQNGYKEQGEFYLTTIRQQRANIPLYLWSQLSQYRDLTPTDQFLREGETDQEYFHRQNRLMNSSQEAAKIAAYKEADRQYEVEYNGVKVSQVIEGMDAENHLQSDDLITALNGEKVRTLKKMNGRLEDLEAGTQVTLTVKRGDETLEKTVEISEFPEDLSSSSRSGLGLLYPYTDRDVQFDPDVEINAGSIGGPSAGLMFSLEIYNQLTESDLTRGKDVAGTGTIDDEGNVGPIGGISEKIVAAENSGVDIFFAPDTSAAEPSNYEQAEKTASDINADMKVVPVQHMEDAITYLNNMDAGA